MTIPDDRARIRNEALEEAAEVAEEHAEVHESQTTFSDVDKGHAWAGHDIARRLRSLKTKDA